MPAWDAACGNGAWRRYCSRFPYKDGVAPYAAYAAELASEAVLLAVVLGRFEVINRYLGPGRQNLGAEDTTDAGKTPPPDGSCRPTKLDRRQGGFDSRPDDVPL